MGIPTNAHIGSFAPYGFSRHPTQKDKLVADPESSAVVQYIFALAIEGYPLTEIARTLNQRNVPTPGQYFESRHPGSNKYAWMSDQSTWTYSMIHRILTKKVYTGTAVGHLRKIVAPLSKKTVKLDEADQIVVEGAHEAIIPAKDFELAQAAIRKLPQKKRNIQMYPLRSLVRCGNCGRMTRYEHGKFYCIYGTTDKTSQCKISDKYSEKDLEAIVFGAIQMYLKAALEDGEQRKRDKAEGLSEIQRRMALLASLQKETESLKKQKMALYERYTRGELSKAVYLEQKAVMDVKLIATKDDMTNLEREIGELESLSSSEQNKSQQLAQTYLGEDSLTWEMAHAFIDAIYVYPDGRREIRWKFKDIAG